MRMKKYVFAESVSHYQAPEVEVIEVEVEKGFAASGNESDGDVSAGGMGGIS